MQKIEIKSFAVLFLFLIVISIYYALTIPSNSIWIDQTLAVNLAKDVLSGRYPLVGYLHSNGMHSFPAFYYLIAPLVYISDNPIFLYWSVPVINILGVLILTKYIYSKFGLQESVMFLVFSATHVSTLFFSSFFWNPNYIPFFMSMFVISVFKYFNSKTSVLFFHIAGIILNLMVQMMPQSIVIIPAFVFLLVLFKKLPSIFNQILHVLLQFVMVYPWIHYYLFIFDWENFNSGQKLYKGFAISIIEYMNYLGGWVLNSEYTTYLAYGTNTYPYTNLIDVFLKTSSFIALILITYATYISLKRIKVKNYINWYFAGSSNQDSFKEKCIVVLVVINFSCILFFLTGMQMVSYHYQFLAPILALMMSLLVSIEKKYKKLLLSALIIFISIQGSFSYWRAFSEYQKPYVTDIGYTDKFLNYFNKNCLAGSTAYILDPSGIHPFRTSYGENGKESCGNLILVLKDHFEQSKIIRWFLDKQYSKTDMKFKDYMIWTSVKLL